MGGTFVKTKKRRAKIDDFDMLTYEELQERSTKEAYKYAKRALTCKELENKQRVQWMINCAQMRLQLGDLKEALADFKEANRLIQLESNQDDPVIKQYSMITKAWIKSCEQLTPELLKKSLKKEPWSVESKVAFFGILASTAIFATVLYLKKN